MEQPVSSDLAGTVTAVLVEAGSEVRAGQRLVAIEAMKMEHPATSPYDGMVTAVLVQVGDLVLLGQELARVRPGEVSVAATHEAPRERADLAELHRRQHLLTDEARPEAVARRHDAGRRTAREVLAALVDEGSWVEYGGLAVAAQRAARSEDDLAARTPGDGFLGGLGRVASRPVAVATYDYTVLAGTQGMVGHAKKDRLFEVVERLRVPVVLFAEGGGGRPNDTDWAMVSGLTVPAFQLWAALSGLVPRIGVAAGRCFAGNAGLLGMCDVVIATRGSSIGMGGPAMIEGGGLGTVAPDDVGPAEMHWTAGSVDVLVADDDEAVVVVRQLLNLFGPAVQGVEQDQTPLREVVPGDRKTAYDVRAALRVLLDPGTHVELRGGFGRSVVTVLGRLDGRTVGVLASDCRHLGGALDSDACDKAARFLQLCEAFGLPVISLVDTPGIMVGPAAEATGLMRHSARLFTIGAQLTVPLVAVVLRKAYGLGAQAMLGGSTRTPLITLAWPTGELAPMGLEGAVRLGLRRELEAADDPEQLVADTLAMALDRARAVSVASYYEVDDVIDPADTRRILAAVLAAAPAWSPSGRRWVDTW